MEARPNTSAPIRELLDNATHSPRVFKGTRTRLHRRLGQTPQEAAKVNATLTRIFRTLEDSVMNPSSSSSSSFGSSFWEVKRRRVEDDTPALAAEVDAKSEALSVLSSPVDVVSWAEENVFTPEFGKTYPRLLAAVMKHLRYLGAPHLALAMFAHARQLGVESYLAGCQTSAFNELLRTRWNAFRDLAGIVSAVGEMKSHAVAWDKNTNSIVSEIVDVVGKELLHNRNHHQWGLEANSLLAQLETALEEDTASETKIFAQKTASARYHRLQRQFEEPGWESMGGERKESWTGVDRRGGGQRGERGERGERGRGEKSERRPRFDREKSMKSSERPNRFHGSREPRETRPRQDRLERDSDESWMAFTDAVLPPSAPEPSAPSVESDPGPFPGPSQSKRFGLRRE